MRSSLLCTSSRLRTRVRSSRFISSLSSSSAAIGTRIGNNTNIVEESSSFFPRKQEFSRKRFLYFSSTGFPNINNGSQTTHGLLPGTRSAGEKQIQQTKVLPSTLAALADRLKEDSRNVNLSQTSTPSSAIIETRQHRRCSSTKLIDSKLAATLRSFPHLILAPSTSASVALMSMSYSTSTSTPAKIATPTIAAMSKDDGENDSRDKQAEGAASASMNDNEIGSSGGGGGETDSSNTNTNAIQSQTKDENKGYKRVRTIKVPQYGPDADKAVRSLQSARKERARVKTSINVQRALYGNMVICAAKLGAWISSGSSSMMSEFVHSVVDCGNQALLLVGLRQTRKAADKQHTYGYGKSVYFWALVSALGTFFMGAGVSMSHSVQTLFHPTLSESISNEVWFVLAMSFIIDGYVLYKTFSEIEEARPHGIPMAKYISKLRDPATLAVLLEDGAACLGIVIAIAGIAASYATVNPIYDGLAGVGISCLLAGIGMALVRVNHSFLIGQAVEREMLDKIEQIIRNRRSIDSVTGIQSQWTGPETFSFKAEVDFDGTYLSALLVPRYRGEFRSAGDKLDEDLEVLLSWYAEDVIRAVEREIRHIEAMIRQQYPGAEYIELEPMSKYVDRFAIDDSFEEKLMMIEKKEIKKWVRVLYENKEENAWRTIALNKDSNDTDSSTGGSNSTSNVVSGSVPTDTLPGSGSTTPGDKLEK